MFAWRIYDHQQPYAQAPGFEPLGGAGGLVRSGRWHHKGHPVIYASKNPSLALLEVLVYETSESFRERMLLKISLDADVETVSHERLVRRLVDAPPSKPEQLTRDFGSRWLREQRSLALAVPSVVMPFEENLIINPLHPLAATSLRVARADVIALDQRLVRSLGKGQSPQQSR